MLLFDKLQTNYQTIDHHWNEDVFATGGERVDLWDGARTIPIRTFQWGVDSIHHVRYNPIEVCCVYDATCCFYDATC